MDKRIFSSDNLIKSLCAFAVLGGLFVGSRKIFIESRQQFPIYPSAALTRMSEYSDGVRGTTADGEVYVFDSGMSGASMLILGGTHNDEPSGHVAAIVMIENLRVKKGRIFIVPRANPSGLTHTTPLEGFLAAITLIHRTANAGSSSVRATPTPSTSGQTPIFLYITNRCRAWLAKNRASEPLLARPS